MGAISTHNEGEERGRSIKQILQKQKSCLHRIVITYANYFAWLIKYLNDFQASMTNEKNELSNYKNTFIYYIRRLVASCSNDITIDFYLH